MLAKREFPVGTENGMTKICGWENDIVFEYLVDKKGRCQGIYRSWWIPDGELRAEYEMKDDIVVRVHQLTDKGRDVVLPDGEIDVWKACRVRVGNETRNVFVQLRVPADARRVTPVDNRCHYTSRVSHGRVVSITDEAGENYLEAESFVFRGPSLRYRLDHIVRAHDFDPNPQNSHGAGLNVHRYRDHCRMWFGVVRS